MRYNFIQALLDMLQATKIRKIDDGLDSEKRRHWAIFYTELEKLSAYYKTFLVESEEE